MTGVRGDISLDGRRAETAWWGAAAARSAGAASATAPVPSPSVKAGLDPAIRSLSVKAELDPAIRSSSSNADTALPESPAKSRSAMTEGSGSGYHPPEGSPPTLVFLHEGLGCIDLWRDVPETLSAWTSLPAFAYSRFGYGQSDPSPLPWPPSYMHNEAALLPRILDAAGITRAILVGHSDGGTIATIHAATGDPRVLALVTIAAHFFVEDINLAAIAAIRDTHATTDLRARLGRYHRDPDNAFHGWNGAWLDPAFRAFDITDAIARVRAPILALQGADDPYGTDAQLAAITDHARVKAETRLVEGARHAPHLEAKKETLAAITGFILDLPT